MASTALRLVDYVFQRFQDGFDCSFDYRLVDYDFKKSPRCARPVPFINAFVIAFPFVKSLIKNVESSISKKDQKTAIEQLKIIDPKLQAAGNKKILTKTTLSKFVDTLTVSKQSLAQLRGSEE